MSANPAVLDALPYAREILKARKAQLSTARPSAREWAERHAVIIDPTEGRMPFRPYSYQAKLLDDDSPRRIVLKARQTGLSNAVALEALHLAATRPDSTILFVSRNQDAARQLITYCYHAMAGGAPTPVLVTENQATIGFANGSTIEALAATPSAGRSKAATRVYLDEFAFCPYDELIHQAVLGTISTGGSLTVLSTPNGRNNLFFRLWQGFEGGEWSRHRVHWSDCPRYDDAWADRTRSGMTRQSFAQEYDCDFVASGDNTFDAADLIRCRDGYDPSPAGIERTVTAWDIGRRQDHSVGITLGLRGEDWHVLKMERILEPYPNVQARIERRVGAFHGRHAVESNGPGDPVIENLNVHVDPFVTTARTKLQAIQALQLLVQGGHFKYDPRLTDEMAQLDRELGLHQFADENLVQDCVMAAAIAAYMAKPPREAWAV